MTQRTDGYRGGIQAGTTASSVHSLGIEQALQEAVTRINKGTSVELWQKAETAERLADRLDVPHGRIAGISPDGGMWVAEDATGRLLLAAEAKKQGKDGNAIERWYKNWAVLSHLNVGVYLTVCLGEGFFDGNSAQRIMETAVALEEGASERFRKDRVWNRSEGRLWIYRYETVPTPFELQRILTYGLAHGRDQLK